MRLFYLGLKKNNRLFVRTQTFYPLFCTVTCSRLAFKLTIFTACFQTNSLSIGIKTNNYIYKTAVKLPRVTTRLKHSKQLHTHLAYQFPKGVQG